ncbi:rhodanese-like domain-containing protein [Halorarum halophilum]|uniref:Rhodanese-like domain-containing protein n=1 Tax=Halorarum halophilum TaxID=2743090 RepID=A0A7D5KJX2_9EURY|nr:rhodanese-like domain-containing protein [Halobaculum halophilum]QLG26215.1 rhodanese-like domain-containing protein [Halobaculum halophilum]
MSDVRKHAWDMAAEAEAGGDVEVLGIEKAHEEWRGGGPAIFLDVRDVRERWLEGAIPGDTHAPRGMLEFWADPETEYYRDYFQTDRRYVCYCNEGGRSALAARTLREMGFEDVAHIEGGFSAWQESKYETAEVEQKEYS